VFEEKHFLHKSCRQEVYAGRCSSFRPFLLEHGKFSGNLKLEMRCLMCASIGHKVQLHLYREERVIGLAVQHKGATLGLALALGGLAVRLEGAADRLGELPALARSARAIARRSSLGPEELSEEEEGFAGARGATAARGDAALRGVFARELEELPRDRRCSIAMARRLSLGPLLLPAPGAGAVVAACSTEG